MQHVKKSWLSIFAYFLVTLDAALFITYFLFERLQVSEAIKAKWGITTVVLIMAAVHAFYVICIFPFIRKRMEWLATIISIALYALVFSTIVDASGNTNLVYRLGYAALVFFMSLSGPFAPVAAVVLTWLIMVFSYSGVISGTQASLSYNLLINVIVTTAAISGWLVFRKFYEKTKDAETIALSKMLEQEQFKSNVMLESITDGVMVINTHGTVEVLNQATAQMLGWDKDEALKLDYHSLLKIVPENSQGSPAVPEKTDIITQTLQSKKSNQDAVLIKTKNGRQVFVDIVASPIFETNTQENGEVSQHMVGVIAVLRDVDEQKRQEQQRSDFISTASHEMRTPIASIQGFLDLVLTPKIWEDREKVKEYIQKARSGTQQLGELFQDLLSTSQSDDGRLANNPEPVEINTFLEKSLEAELPKALQKDLTVNYKFLEGKKVVTPHLYVSADPQRLNEVIQNLFNNALKYTEQGSITISTALHDEKVQIAITDTGMGIAEEDMPHLFQKFYRTDNSATREIGGTGLGLYLCKQIVTMMNGTIWVESKLHQGSTFYVELPRIDRKD